MTLINDGSISRETKEGVVVVEVDVIEERLAKERGIDFVSEGFINFFIGGGVLIKSID